MARNYAALPWEYLEEMDALEDGEFGRLARALIRYSMTGEPMALTGNERFFAKRVMAQEDRYQESYRRQSSANAQNGASGGRPSKSGKHGNKPNSGHRQENKAEESEKKRTKPNETEITHTETETNTETDIYDNDNDNDNARAREEPDCVQYFRSSVNPLAPQRDYEEMAQFIADFNARGGDGNGMVIRACDMALSNRAANWSYVAKCLKDWLSRGIYTPEALDAHERDRRWKQEKNAGKPVAPTAPQKPNPDPDAWLKKNQWGPRPPGTI